MNNNMPGELDRVRCRRIAERIVKEHMDSSGVISYWELLVDAIELALKAEAKRPWLAAGKETRNDR